MKTDESDEGRFSLVEASPLHPLSPYSSALQRKGEGLNFRITKVE